MSENSKRPHGFVVDEEPLRQNVLEAYHEARATSEKARRGVDAVRQFLSGPPGEKAVPDRYWFEEDPPASLRSFIEDLDRTDPRLVSCVLEPMLAAVEEMTTTGRRTPAPNIGVWVASLSGACAVQAELDETVATAIVSATAIGLSRLGTAPFASALAD